jgi:hypothetical protein
MNKIGINIFLALAVGVILYLVSHGNLMMAAMVPGALIACRLVTVRGPLIYWAILLEFAQLQLPVSDLRNIRFSLIIEGLFVAGELLNLFAGKEKLRFGKSSKLIFLFCFILAVTAKIRGFGIYMLGGSSIGGLDYVTQITRFAFLGFVAAYVAQHGLNIRKVYIYALIGALIHLTLSLIALFMPEVGRLFASITSVAFYTGRFGEAGVKRIHALGDTTFVLMPFILCVKDFIRRHILVILCVLLAAFSSFRTAMLLVLVVFFFAELRIHGMNQSKLTGYVILGLILFGALWVVAPKLDWRIQRTLSSVPGLSSRMANEASRDASNSTEWRLELYATCLRHVPEYLLIGRGLGSSLGTTLNQLSAVDSSMDLFYEFRIYHLAILELLLDYGGLATVIFFAAFLTELGAAGRRIKRHAEDDGSCYEKFATGCLLAVLISFLTFLSDFRSTYFHLLIFSYIACAGAGVGPSESAKKTATAPPAKKRLVFGR